MCLYSLFGDILITSRRRRVLLSDCEILDERFRTCSHIPSDSKVDFVQDLDGSGEIGIEEVS